VITIRNDVNHQVNNLVGLIYDASRNSELWPMVQQRMCALSGGLGSHILLFDSKRKPIETIIHSSLDERAAVAMEEDYIHWYHQFDDYRIEAAISNGSDVVMSNDELTPNERKKNCPLYNEYFRYYDAEEQLIYGSPISNELALAIVHARPREAGAHTDEERQLFLYLANHIRRSMELRQQLKLASSLNGSLIDVLSGRRHGAIAVDQSGSIIWANDYAKTNLLDKNVLKYVNGRLSLDNKVQNKELEELVQQAVQLSTQGYERCGFAKIGTSDEPMLLTVFSTSVEQAIFSDSRPVAILFFSFPDKVEPPSRQLIKDFFQLTPSEARLAFGLAEGKQLDQCAEETSIRISTARSCLKSINSKMGCHTQHQLVKKIMSLLY